ALATLQAAWVGPSVAGAAGFLVLPFLLGGLIAWATGSATTVVLGALVAFAGLVLVGVLPWGFVFIVAIGAVLLAALALRVAGMLPPSVDQAWSRARGRSIAWSVLALLMVLQVTRLSAFMADSDNAWGSTFPPIEFTIGHMCMASYVHAADLARHDAENVYSPEHYPSFGQASANDIHTTIDGIQSYFDDAFLYAPAFLLLPRAWLAVSNDYRNIRTVWFAVQFLAFVAFAVFLARWVGGATGAWALWLFPLVLASMPTMFNFQFGQAHALTIWTAIAAMVAFDSKRPALGGALLAWGIASKIFPGVLGLYLLLQRRWLDLAWTFGFTVLLVAFSVVVVGTGPALQFTEYMLPRLASGEAFSFITDELPIVTNLSVPGSVWKLDFFGAQDGGAWLGVASWAYTAFLVVAVWIAARFEGHPTGGPSNTDPAHAIVPGRQSAGGEKGHAVAGGATHGGPDRARKAQIWLAILILASLRSPIVPIYGALPILWLMTLEFDRVRTTLGVVGFIASWIFINGLPPAPEPRATIVMVAVTQVAILYWVIRPLRWSRAAAT
ncbi:MAG: glycosyltransferase family 87 protein, partial [Myxococcota bacterium]